MRNHLCAAWLASLVMAGESEAVATCKPISAPIGQVGSWELIFNDDFDDRTLDKSHWTTCYWWDENGCTNLATEELQWYLPDNVRVEGGLLRLSAREESVKGYKGRTFNYTSGIVTTGGNYVDLPSFPRFATQYGYFEICAKLPAGKGLWPAFWLLPATRESKPEIDIMELRGDRPDRLEMHFHYKRGDKEQVVGKSAKTTDLSEDWHTYGLLWKPEVIVWYLDGIEQWRYADRKHIPKQSMYLLLNLAVGGEWVGDPGSATDFPTDLLVDYVRVWRYLE